MTTYRGLDGFLSLGGQVTGTPKLRYSVATGATVIQITGAGSTLTGVVCVGDVFTISGGVDLTVAGSYYEATGNAFPTTIPLASTVATVAATGATLAFDANSVAQCKLHELNVDVEMYDSTVMGTNWHTYYASATLLGSWTGRGECYLDYDDGKQAALIDDIAAASPVSSEHATIFGAATGKMFYGSILMSGFKIAANTGALATVEFNFQGTGVIRPRWD